MLFCRVLLWKYISKFLQKCHINWKLRKWPDFNYCLTFSTKYFTDTNNLLQNPFSSIIQVCTAFCRLAATAWTNQTSSFKNLKKYQQFKSEIHPAGSKLPHFRTIPRFSTACLSTWRKVASLPPDIMRSVIRKVWGVIKGTIPSIDRAHPSPASGIIHWVDWWRRLEMSTSDSFINNKILQVSGLVCISCAL